MNKGELSKDLKVIEQEIAAYQKIAGECIFEIGGRLEYVKENDLVHGEWGNWLESIGMNKHTATRMMKTYNVFGSNPEKIKNISTSVIYELLSFDSPIDMVDDLKGKTVREIRTIKRKLARKDSNRRTIEILKQDNSIFCSCCKIDCTPITHWHHIVPLSSGGESDGENLIPICPNCHSVIHSLLSEKNKNIDLDRWLKNTYSVLSVKKLKHLVLFTLDAELALRSSGKFVI